MSFRPNKPHQSTQKRSQKMGPKNGTKNSSVGGGTVLPTGEKPGEMGRFAFMKVAPLFSTLSLVLVLVSLFFISTKGLKYGIDFAGGTEIQLEFPDSPPLGELRSHLEEMVGSVTVQTLDEGGEVVLRINRAESGVQRKNKNESKMKSEMGVEEGMGSKRTSGGPHQAKESNQRIQEIIASVVEKFKLPSEALRRVDSVGPQVGEELKVNGFLAVLYSLIMILIYVGLRFDYKYAPGAVLCLFHDALITLGVFCLLGKEVNIQILAAILTIIGYSLNDTIINFDRIRENESSFKGKSLYFIINRSINDVLSRTLLTSITTLLAVGALYLFAGGVIEDLAFTLGIGVVVGTYSSIYVASPLVLVTDKWMVRWNQWAN